MRNFPLSGENTDGVPASRFRGARADEAERCGVNPPPAIENRQRDRKKSSHFVSIANSCYAALREGFRPREFAGRTAKNSERQNLLDDAHGFSAALHPIIGLLVIRQAFLVEFTKTRSRRGRAAGHPSVHTAAEGLPSEQSSQITTDPAPRGAAPNSRMSAALRGCANVPPPSARTKRVFRSDADPKTRARHSCSISRNTASPFCSKICEMERPDSRSISASRSAKCQASCAASRRPDRALARTHESGQANHAAFRDRPWRGLFDGDESCKRFRER